MYFVAAAFLALALVPTTGAAGGVVGEACPPPLPRAEARVQHLLRIPGIRDLPERFDLGTAAPEDLRVLTSTRDRDTCLALRQALRAAGTNLREGDAVSFFRSGNRYFAPITPGPGEPGVIRIGERGGIEVYDLQFRLMARFGG
jgi:hypothetical protein